MGGFASPDQKTMYKSTVIKTVWLPQEECKLEQTRACYARLSPCVHSMLMADVTESLARARRCTKCVV